MNKILEKTTTKTINKTRKNDKTEIKLGKNRKYRKQKINT